MIQRVSHASVYVLDQDAAKAFYVDKLGFEVRHDEGMGGFRWLTIGPKGQKDLDMVLLPIMPSPMMDAATADAFRGLVKKGAFCCGVLETDDCRKTYDELTAKGVEFMGPPAERPYGIEALLKDSSGNWWSVVQRPR
jgi:predicted enzyme related to lactoylglutathione lyase